MHTARWTHNYNSPECNFGNFFLHLSKRPEHTQIPLPLPSKSNLHWRPPSNQTLLPQPPTTIVVDFRKEKKKCWQSRKEKLGTKLDPVLKRPFQNTFFLHFWKGLSGGTFFCYFWNNLSISKKYTFGEVFPEYTFPFYIYGNAFLEVYFYTSRKVILEVSFYTSWKVFP